MVELLALALLVALLIPAALAADTYTACEAPSSLTALSQEQANLLLEAHRVWLNNNKQSGDEAYFARRNLKGLDFSGQALNGVSFSEANLEGARFDGARLNGANFNGAHLKRASFEGAELVAARFHGACLRYSDFERAALMRAEFGKAKLYGADLSYAKATGASFNGADLTKATLSGTGLVGVDFNHAILTGADLWRADVRNAVYIPKTHPFLPHFAFAANLSHLRFGNNPTGILELGKKFETAGYVRAAREVIHALIKRAAERYVDYRRLKVPLIEIEKELQTYIDAYKAESDKKKRLEIEARWKEAKCRLAAYKQSIDYVEHFHEIDYLEFEHQQFARLSAWGRFWERARHAAINALFGLTTYYGLRPFRPLAGVMTLWLLASIYYAFTIYLSPSTAKLLLAVSRLNDPSKKRLLRLRRRRADRKSKLIPHLLSEGNELVRCWRIGLFFGLMSVANIGFRGIDFGRWIRMFQPRPFDIVPMGWTRTVSAAQALLSLTLLLLALITYFGGEKAGLIGLFWEDLQTTGIR